MRVAVYRDGKLETVLEARDLQDAQDSCPDALVVEVQGTSRPPATLPN